jgi:hypothetical protein
LGATVYGGAAVFVAGIVVGYALGQEPIWEVSLPGFAVAFVANVFAQWIVFPCPRCGRDLGAHVIHHGGFCTDEEVRFCLYCGTEITDGPP